MKRITKEELLKVINEKTKTTLAHKLAAENKLPKEFYNDIEILNCEDKNFTKVAIILIDNGHFFEDLDILKLRVHSLSSETIAHYQVKRGWTTEHYGILRMTYAHNKTVAHFQAERGWTTNRFEVLRLDESCPVRVAHVQAEKGWKSNDPRVLILKSWSRISVLEKIFEVDKYWIPSKEAVYEIYYRFKIASELALVVKHRICSMLNCELDLKTFIKNYDELAKLYHIKTKLETV